jgi:hypothetical protein
MQLASLSLSEMLEWKGVYGEHTWNLHINCSRHKTEDCFLKSWSCFHFFFKEVACESGSVGKLSNAEVLEVS